MFCKNCGREMTEGQAICVGCGMAAGDGNKFCSNCGKEIAEGAAVCLNCGVSLKKDPNAKYLNGQDKIVMALLAFFLGGFGIHCFMMGETKKGVTRLCASLCCGLGGILALIDMIMILCDSYVVDPEKLFF